MCYKNCFPSYIKRLIYFCITFHFSGHYLYIDALHSKPKTAAVIVSRTIDAQAEAGCRLSFWYIMYGKDMGALAVYDAIWFGFPYNQTWYLEGDQGNAWKKAIVPLGTDLPFQVITFIELIYLIKCLVKKYLLMACT